MPDRKKNLVVVMNSRAQREDQPKSNLEKGPSELEILKTLSDRVSLNIIASVASGIRKPTELNNTTDFSKKQFYSRTALMIREGLIKRDHGHVFLTSLGKISYHVKLKVENAIRIYWKLKAIDSIQTSGQINEHERLKLVKTILNDNMIENILVRQS